MEEHNQVFDICIVCAMYEEAEAVLKEFSERCGVSFESAFSQMSRYAYRYTWIQNKRKEPLSILVTWPSDRGPVQTGLDLNLILQEFRPRFAAMTGICAGDRKKVKLGDLIIAECAYLYEEGKVISGPGGQNVHLIETKTAASTSQVIQYAKGFDGWKELLRAMKRARLKRELKPTDEPKRFIVPMASGMAVRSDNPFPWLKERFHRNTIALDMEAATFYRAFGAAPHIHAFVVKGVSDYGDGSKNDTFHEYAARASAVYLLSFIQEYVTEQTMPRRDAPPPSSRAGPPRIWNVPYHRNPYFTGRDELLARLDRYFAPSEQAASLASRRVALTQPQAITGLGGIGKTQLAVEYAYCSREQGRYTHTFWVNAASTETILASFVEIAALLPAFAARSETDQQKLIEAVKRWLEHCEQPWLLIFDNIDHDEDLPAIREYLPQRGNGGVLLTTRASAVGSLATPVEVDTMGFIEGSLLLLRRAHRVKPAFDLEHLSDEEIDQIHRAGNIVEVLDHFPLALDQAGAYIEETQCSFEEYLGLYQAHRQQLLAERGRPATEYPDSVATTWSLSFHKVQQKSPATAELLQLCSFLAPDRIPEELITDGAAHWPTLLQQATSDPFAFQQMMKELLKYSLVNRLVEDRTLSIHRLVQAVQRDMIAPEEQYQWAERVVRAVNEVFPDDPKDPAIWPLCLRYLDQTQVCNQLVAQYLLQFVEAADLLNRTGTYLNGHALYTLAEPLCQRALRIMEQSLGPEHLNVADPLCELAGMYVAQKKYEQAEPLYQRALRIMEQSLGPEHPDVALPLFGLAVLYEAQDKGEQAEPLAQRALQIRDQSLGPEHPYVADTLNGLAVIYVLQGKYAEAEPLYQRALEIKERNLGPEHPYVATSLYGLASLYQAQNKYEQAEPLCQRALQIMEQSLGPEHPNVAMMFNNLANLYQAQNKYEQAEPLYQRALQIMERSLGPEHLLITSPLNNLASLYYEQGKYEQAEPLYQRILWIIEQSLGPEHPDVAVALDNLVDLYQAQNKHEQAEPLYQRALQIMEQGLGPQHPDVASLLNNLANLYSKQDKYGEAEPLYHRALHIWEQNLGPQHLQVASALTNLTILYYAQGKYEEAEPLCQRALHIREQNLGPQHPLTQQVRSSYAILLRAMKREVEAGKLEENA